MIHRRVLRDIMANGRPCTLTYVKASTGELITLENVQMTSENYGKRVLNIKIMASGQIRTLRTILILTINGEDIFV